MEYWTREPKVAREINIISNRKEKKRRWLIDVTSSKLQE